MELAGGRRGYPTPTERWMATGTRCMPVTFRSVTEQLQNAVLFREPSPDAREPGVVREMAVGDSPFDGAV